MAKENDQIAELVAQSAGAAGELALGPLGGVLGMLAQPVVREWRRAHSQAMRAAERQAGLSREDLEEVLAQHPETVPLVVVVLMSAGQNGHDQTLRAMGAALGAAAAAARDGRSADMEDAEVALRAMREFTPRHFRVLGAMIDARNEPHTPGDPVQARYNPHRIAPRLGLEVVTVEHLASNLASAGLLTVFGGYGGAFVYELTTLGEAIAAAAALVDDQG